MTHYKRHSYKNKKTYRKSSAPQPVSYEGPNHHYHGQTTVNHYYGDSALKQAMLSDLSAGSHELKANVPSAEIAELPALSESARIFYTYIKPYCCDESLSQLREIVIAIVSSMDMNTLAHLLICKLNHVAHVSIGIIHSEGFIKTLVPLLSFDKGVSVKNFRNALSAVEAKEPTKTVG